MVNFTIDGGLPKAHDTDIVTGQLVYIRTQKMVRPSLMKRN